jgi:hypothetical protein
MLDEVGYEVLLQRVDALEREVERLRRDLFHSVATKPQARRVKPSLFGSVRGGDVTEDMIEAAKRALFRPAEDL